MLIDLGGPYGILYVLVINVKWKWVIIICFLFFVIGSLLNVNGRKEESFFFNVDLVCGMLWEGARY